MVLCFRMEDLRMMRSTSGLIRLHIRSTPWRDALRADLSAIAQRPVDTAGGRSLSGTSPEKATSQRWLGPQV